MMKTILGLFMLAGLVAVASANDLDSLKKQQEIEKRIINPKPFERPIAKAKYIFPSWVFADPVGDNALRTTAQLETSDKPLYTYTNYFRRFSPSFCKYGGDKTVMQVARTQTQFDAIMKKMVGSPADLPRELDFEKELFIFVFNGTQNANLYTLVEVAEVDRNNGAIELGEESFRTPDGVLVTKIDEVIVRVGVQIGKPDLVQKGFSPWTMIRVNKETFFAEHPESDETRFAIIESREHVYTRRETPVDGKQ